MPQKVIDEERRTILQQLNAKKKKAKALQKKLDAQTVEMQRTKQEHRKLEAKRQREFKILKADKSQLLEAWQQKEQVNYFYCF